MEGIVLATRVHFASNIIFKIKMKLSYDHVYCS